MAVAVMLVPALAAGQESTGVPGVRRRLAQCSTPAIVAQPSDQSIQRGGTATLSVVATGLEPLAFQWHRGVTGDTSTPVGGTPRR